MRVIELSPRRPCAVEWSSGSKWEAKNSKTLGSTLGSTGGCQDPGRVRPGKKMAGRMGGVRRTTFSARVWRVCDERGLIWVKGQVPGGEGGFVEIRDAVRPRRGFRQPPLPFPTSAATVAEAEAEAAAA